MIPRVVMLVLLAVIALALDTVLLTGFTVAGVSPSLAIVSVVAIAWSDGPASGSRYGFAVGLGIDLLAGGLVGLSALVLLLVGYGVGVGRRYWTGSPVIGQLIAGLVGAGGSALGHIMLERLFDQTRVGALNALGQSAVAAVFGLLLAPLVIPPLARVSSRFSPFGARGPRLRR